MSESDNRKLKKLLEEFELRPAYKYLHAAGITYSILKYIERDDLKEAIPPLGLRIQFRHKLFEWRKKQFSKEVGVQTQTTKELDNFREIKHPPVISQSSGFIEAKTQKTLFTLLNTTARGVALLDYYQKNNCLTDELRDDLVNFIIEEFIYNDVVIRGSEFSLIVKDICSLFPSETAVQEYYFGKPVGKKNPVGKLYTKYSNSRHRRRKICNPDIVVVNEPIEESIEDLEEQVLLKNLLKRGITDWSQYCDYWKKSYKGRQLDYKNLTIIEFFQEWPKYKDARAPELINIDFNLMHPGKGNLLIEKWESYKYKIIEYLNKNVSNSHCRSQLTELMSSKDADIQDYLLSSLLIAVVPSSARFKNEEGKICLKITISDGQESFILQVQCIDDYKRRVDEIRDKYYSSGNTIQPFLIVEMSLESKGFYIYFNNILYKFETFISALNTCFQIFHIFSLEYPRSCYSVWTFFQLFFYNITTKFDIRSPKVISLINFLENNRT